ncbi:MAG: sigma-70 family RNA polymerase sigma factor [Myxococcaceae bacterium]
MLASSLVLLFLATLSDHAVAERGSPLNARERERLTELYTAHYDVVWRVLRRSGLGNAQADDGAQQVFLVALRRLGDLVDGRERAFLCATALVVARKLKTSRGREEIVDEVPEVESTARPDEQAEHRRNLRRLDVILGELEEELRAVFVLQDIEGLSKRETALALGIPEGTVATRLRRARERFEALLARELGRRAP